jgi:hypothetical protein
MDVHTLTNQTLRSAIWRNQASFPSVVPVFEKQTRPDIQWRVVQLYFVRGWSFGDLAKRYQVTPQRVMQIVTLWRIRAVTLGYIQEIPSEDSVPAPRIRQDQRPELEPMLPYTSDDQSSKLFRHAATP